MYVLVTCVLWIETFLKPPFFTKTNPFVKKFCSCLITLDSKNLTPSPTSFKFVVQIPVELEPIKFLHHPPSHGQPFFHKPYRSLEEFKACKNDVETQGLKHACKRDSVALCELLSSLEQRFIQGTNGDAVVTRLAWEMWFLKKGGEPQVWHLEMDIFVMLCFFRQVHH